ncbi:MAG: SET domain-containing protein-lysine N-methyltransferase [Ferruginibacter sp.]
MTTTNTASNFEVISRFGFVDVLRDPSTNQKSLHATISFVAGQVISKFYAGITQSYATYLTVQKGIDTHITLEPDFLQYINHSCSPNVFFDTNAMELICLRPIQAGEEFTFFYPSTEWNMSQPFVCNCKSNECLQLINGASHLDLSTLNKYRLTDFIKQQSKQKHSM